MSLFSKILFLIVAGIIAYGLWPRETSLQRFDPKDIARSELDMFRSIRNGEILKSTADCYKIYDFQYQMRPVAAVNIGRDTTALISGILRAPDAITQDTYSTPAAKLFLAIREEVKGNFDANLAGHYYKTIWIQLTENSTVSDVAKSLAEYWAALYKLPATQFKKAADIRAAALVGAFEVPAEQVNWGKVGADLKASWAELRKAVPQPPKADKKP